ncbi:MAG: hypothetical protein V1722_05420 [Candidatus Micrarchaeota archaeon]
MHFEIEKTDVEKQAEQSFTIYSYEEGKPKTQVGFLKIYPHSGRGIYVNGYYVKRDARIKEEFIRQFYTTPARMLLLHATKDHGSQRAGCLFKYGTLTPHSKRITSKLVSEGFFEVHGSNFHVPPEKVKSIKQMDLANPSKEHMERLFSRH